MYYLKRKYVCEKIGISEWQSYQILPANSLHMISTDYVINLLNNARRNEPIIDYIPQDLCCASVIALKTGIPERNILLWTKRKKNVIPYYHINNQTKRFRQSSVETWLAKEALKHG